MSLADKQLAVLIGTRKGLFIARGERERREWTLEGPHLAGYEIQAAFLDPRSPRRGFAAAHHPVWGIHLYRSDDAGHTWEALAAVPTHGRGDDDPQHLRMIWSLAPGPSGDAQRLIAGIEPAGLFVSPDAGGSWHALPGFNAHPTRALWSPAKGGLAVHSLQVDPHDDARWYCALSAGGSYRSDDRGERWQPINAGIRAPYLPGAPAAGHCVHRLLVHPALAGRLYQQSHHGTYRSDDYGEHWHEITSGLPSDFGYALATDPRAPDRLYTIPEQSSQLRATVAGRLRVYRSDDAGESWQPLTAGLPQEHVFVTVLRDGLASDGLEPLGLYLGTASGHLFTSRDAGESWTLVAGFLPGILSVRAAEIAP